VSSVCLRLVWCAFCFLSRDNGNGHTHKQTDTKSVFL
jgi:hypothetical protein